MFKNREVMIYNRSMKRLILGFIALIASLTFVPAYADVDNFRFSDFTGDYYLGHDEEGASRLKVVERMTAIFPDFNQNKGICRQISFANQGGANITLPKLDKTNLKVTRNGHPENIYSIERDEGFYNVCTGTEEYVTGAQIYVFEYEFINVVTDFDDYQELYWDANGTGSLQPFGSVTARLHFEDSDDYTGEAWCYVGKYGANGQERCKITNISDGVEFSTKDLARYEGLTFVAKLKEDSFVVAELQHDYIFVIAMMMMTIISTLIVVLMIRRYLKYADKIHYYKDLFVKPEYQPNKGYSLAEMAEIYIGKTKDTKVAMLLEMIVLHKIELQKIEKKKWQILVKDLSNVRAESIDLLKILNGGETPEVEAAILLKRQSSSYKLVKIRNSMQKTIEADLERDGLAEKGYDANRRVSDGLFASIVGSIIVSVFIAVFMAGGITTFVTSISWNGGYGKVFIGREAFYWFALILIAVVATVAMTIEFEVRKYKMHTMKGLEMSRYMDGLKMYIKMAEADRMKLLQSVEGADVSKEGIVKLYEELLPYAAVFGLEQSWLNEMKNYCDVQGIAEPDYLLHGITAYELTKMMHTTSGYISTAASMSSSGGGFSSSSSGSGGGGFSGGGGGGGGFSGR